MASQIGGHTDIQVQTDVDEVVACSRNCAMISILPVRVF